MSVGVEGGSGMGGVWVELGENAGKGTGEAGRTPTWQGSGDTDPRAELLCQAGFGDFTF